MHNWKRLLLFAFIGPCSWIATYIGVISKENGYLSTAMGKPARLRINHAKSEFSIWKKPNRLVQKMCEDKNHLNFRLCFELDVLETRNAKLSLQSFLCRLVCVAEIRAVASAWSHSSDIFYSGPYFLTCGRSTYMSLRVRYNQIGLYVLTTRQYWERTLLKWPVLHKNKSEIIKQMQYDASTTDQHDPDQL